MAQIIKPKRGTTAPTTSNLVSGEIAVDTANQRLYINDAGSIKVIGVGGSEIASGQDLNTFRTTGLYSQNSNADAAAGSNYPVALAGMLEVLNDDKGNGIHTVQRYSRYNANNVYHRYYYNGTWSSWRDLAQDNNTVYTHPSYTTRSINTNGATVIDTFTSDGIGSVTGITTRTMTLADLGYTGATNANNYVLPEATATTLGGIELFSNTDQSVAANAVTSTAGRTYGIQLNSSGQAVVNVPWVDTNTDTNTTYDYLVPANTTALRLAGSDFTTDTITLSSSGATSLTRISGNEIQISSTDTNTVYTHPSYSAINLNTNGATVIDTMTVDTIGSVSGITTRSMTLADLGYTGATNANNYVLPEATATVKGGIELFSNVDQSVAANSVTTTAGRTYGLQLNAAGQAVVNVPWTDTVTSITQTEGNFDIEPKDAGGVAVTGSQTNRCRYFRVGNRCQVDIYIDQISKGSVSGTSPVRFHLPSGIPQPRASEANGAPKTFGTSQIMGVNPPNVSPASGTSHWRPVLTYGTGYIVFEGEGTGGTQNVVPDVMLWGDVTGFGAPSSNISEFYVTIQYEV